MTAMKNLMKGLKSLGSSGKSSLSKFILKHALCSAPSHEDSAAHICSWRYFNFLHVCPPCRQVPADRCALVVGTPLSAGRWHPGR